jgi:acetoin utilization protein AcuB
MFVSKTMTRKVITIDKDAGIFEAYEKMKENRIRHLPVTDADNRLIGMVTDRDIRSVMPYELFKDPDLQKIEKNSVTDMKIADIMTIKPVHISPSSTIQDALLLIEQMRIGALPVVDDEGRLKGIISVRDLLRAFTNVLGIGDPGTLLCILVEEKVGQLKKIVDAITEEGVSFGSVLVGRYWDEGKRAVFPYIRTQNVAHIKRKLTQMGFTLLDPIEWYLDQLPSDE